MINDLVPSSADEYPANIMQALAAYIICNLDEVQNAKELSDLRNHADLEISQEANLIWEELQQLKAKLEKI